MPSDFKQPARVKNVAAIVAFRIKMIGEPCDECEQRTGVHVHHKVFRSQGGSDVADNFAWLCGVCHDAAHGIRRVT